MAGDRHVHTKVRFAGGYFRLRDVLAKTSPELKKSPDLVGQQGYIGSSVRNLVKNIDARHLVVLERLNLDAPRACFVYRAEGQEDTGSSRHFIPLDRLCFYGANYHPKSREALLSLCDNPGIVLSQIDVSSVTDLHDLFYKSPRTDFGGIEKWDVSHVTNLDGLFSECSFDGDLSGWDVSGVTSLACMISNGASDHETDSARPYTRDLSRWLNQDSFRALRLEKIFPNMLGAMYALDAFSFVQGEIRFYDPYRDFFDLFTCYVGAGLLRGKHQFPFEHVQRSEINRRFEEICRIYVESFRSAERFQEE